MHTYTILWFDQSLLATRNKDMEEIYLHKCSKIINHAFNRA